MSKRGIVLCCVLAAASASLAGCVGTAVGAGAVTATAALEERGLRGAANDLRIRAEINTLWLDHDVDMYSEADVTVYEGRVLLTGIVPTEQARQDAVRLAWQADGTKEVINEIRVGEVTGVTDDARDGWITAQLSSRLALDEKVQSINYAIETVDGVVYLMGIAQDEAELRRVRNHARDISYVRRVVSYVRLKGDAGRKAAR